MTQSCGGLFHLAYNENDYKISTYNFLRLKFLILLDVLA